MHVECIIIYNTPTWRNSFKRLLCTGCIVIFCQEKHLPFPPPACSYGWNFILRNFLSRISDHYNAGRDFCPVKIFSSMEYLCTCTLYWKYFSLAWLDRGALWIPSLEFFRSWSMSCEVKTARVGHQNLVCCLDSQPPFVVFCCDNCGAVAKASNTSCTSCGHVTRSIAIPVWDRITVIEFFVDINSIVLNGTVTCYCYPCTGSTYTFSWKCVCIQLGQPNWHSNENHNTLESCFHSMK